jgi:penicillin-binding protein 1A
MRRFTLDSFRLDRAEIRRWCRRGLDLLAGRRRHLVVAASVLAACVTLVAADVVLGTPSAGEIRGMTSMPVATTILDRDDQPAFTVYEERRLPVPLARVSPHVVQAVLAVEDERFYEHDGLDLRRIGGAMFANIREGGWAQGGSTITQQLARQSFLTSEKSLRRKLKEAYLAVRIERRFTKDEILETYLNKVYFGAGFYGIEAAARGYFGKAASDLDVAEAALLAGVIQAPSAYAPTSHPDRATDRRAVVLHRMADIGAIDNATARDLAGRPLVLVNGFEHEGSGAYFKQAVTRELVERFGWDMVS